MSFHLRTATSDVGVYQGWAKNLRGQSLQQDQCHVGQILTAASGSLARVLSMTHHNVTMTTDLGRWYLAGPMRNYPLFNFPAFLSVEAVLKNRGFKIESPAQHDLANGFDPSKTLEQQVDTFKVEDALGWDFQMIPQCHGIILMNGWEKSTGAKAERLIASMTKKEILRIDEQTMELREDTGWTSSLEWTSTGKA